MKQTNRQVIHSDAAPGAIGTYSQAIKVNNTVYISGQIPLDPNSMALVTGGISNQIHQVFANLKAIAEAAGGSLSEIVKLNVYLLDLNNFNYVNTIMAEYFPSTYPARAVIGVAALPRGAEIEMDAVMVLSEDL